MSTELRDQVVVIIGASSGIGKGVARRVADCGGKLVLSARRGELLEELARECRQTGTEALPCVADISLAKDVEQLCRAAVERFGRIDVWVNDAGVGVVGRFEDIPLEDHVKLIETNLIGVLHGTYYAMHQFRQQSTGGVLINLSSALGKIPAPYYSSYVASKFGIVGLGASIRQELHENDVDNIRICTVMPMAMDTPFFDHSANYTGHEAVPIPPLYDPKESVDAIVDLMTSPKDEVVIGTAGKLSNMAHRIMPGVVKNYLGSQTHKTQFEDAPPAPPTSGSIHTPVAIGTGVSAGRLARARS